MAPNPRERAKFMSDRTAKVFALRGDETCFAVIECCEEKTRSSAIQPSLAAPIMGFQEASVKTDIIPYFLGFGSVLIKALRE